MSRSVNREVIEFSNSIAQSIICHGSDHAIASRLFGPVRSNDCSFDPQSYYLSCFLRFNQFQNFIYWPYPEKDMKDPRQTSRVPSGCRW